MADLQVNILRAHIHGFSHYNRQRLAYSAYYLLTILSPLRLSSLCVDILPYYGNTKGQFHR